jgi:adenylate kinase family enzyme
MEGGTDLDVLADINQQSQIERALMENGYHHVISHPWNTYNFVSDWIGTDNLHGQQTHIHLHYKLLTGKQNVKEQYLPWTELVLQNRVFNEENKIWICNPNIEVFLFVSRVFLKRFDFRSIPNDKNKFKLSKPDIQEMTYLREYINQKDLEYFASLMFPESLRDLMIKLAVNPDAWVNEQCRKIKKDLVASLAESRDRSKLVTNLQSFFRFGLQKFGSISHHPINKKKKVQGKGKLISFLGVDGSGKTTVAKDIQKWLSWKIDCRYVYLGTGQGKSSLLNRLVRARGEKKIAAGEVVNTQEKAAETANTHISFKKAAKKTLLNVVALSNMKYKYKTIKNIEKMKGEGVIVLTDRFPQDKYFGINDGANITPTGQPLLDVINNALSRKEKKLLGNILQYHPDIIIKLIIPLEVSRSRKQDSPIESIKRKIEIVNALHYDGAKEYEVCSDLTIEETEDQVKRIVWENI